MAHDSNSGVPRVTVGSSMISQETRYQLAKMVTLRRGELPALEGDFCRCRCSPMPQLIASQHDWTYES